MEKTKREPKENISEEENLDINLNIQRPKSISFKMESNNKENNISDYKRVRFYSENIPSNFVPKLKPIKSDINPTPMKLNHLFSFISYYQFHLLLCLKEFHSPAIA